jgi:cysteine sulfinate desulfinase/cysteine desulfurase-like protein
MGIDRHRALAAVRLSVGRWTCDEDIERAAIHVTEAARRLDTRAAI